MFTLKDMIRTPMYSYLDVELKEGSWVRKMLDDPDYLPTRDEVIAWSRRDMDYALTRFRYVENFGYNLVTKDILNEFVSQFGGAKILEVGAGRGFFASWLYNEDVDIWATDSGEWNGGYKPMSKKDNPFSKPFMPMLYMDAVNAIDEYANRADYVMMTWPPYMERMAYRVLMECQKLHKPLLYLGEWYGGCCADFDFFDAINDRKIKHEKILPSFIPFLGVHDEWWLIY